MGIGKRTLYGIIKRPFRSISLTAILAASMIGTLFGIYLESMLHGYQGVIQQQTGFCISLFAKKEEEGIPDELAERIGNQEFVLGYNAETSMDVMPLDFQNYIPPEVLDGDFDFAGDKSQVRLWGSVNTEYSSYFFQQQAVLAEGKFPEKGSNEVLVEQEFAAYNHLHVSDKIHVPRETDGEAVTLEIAGIYERNQGISETLMISSVNGFYQNTPFSYIFCDYGVLEQMAGGRIPKSVYSFYARDEKGTEKLETYVKELNLDESLYEYSNLAKEAESNFSNILGTLQKSSRTFLLIANISIYGILFLMTFLWMRDHCREAGIYIALGRNRFAILLDYMLELAVIACAAFSLSFAVFRAILSRYGNLFLRFFSETGKRDIQYQPLDLLFVDYGITGGMFLRTLIAVGGILFAAALVSSIPILGFRTRKLFEMK